MNIFTTTLEAVITLMGIGLLGFWIIARKKVPEAIMDVVPPLAIDIALPCLVIYNILGRFNPGAAGNWWSLPLWWAGFTGIAFVVTLLLAVTVRREFRREFTLSLFYQNSTFLPIAIISGIYGYNSPYLADLFIFSMLYPAFFFNTYHLFFKKSFKRKVKEERAPGFSFDLSRLFNPVLIATLLALTLKLTGASVYVPGVLITITDDLGRMTIPLIIIIIGGSIYIDFRGKGTIHRREIFQFIFYKNIVMPAVILPLIMVLKPSYNIALILLLQSATPPITAAPIVTERAGGNRGIVNQFLVSSFIISLLTIPALMWLFHRLYKI